MNNVLRALVYDEQVSLTLIDTTELVREGKKRHALTPLSAYVFGKAFKGNVPGNLSSFKYSGWCLQ